MLNLSVRERLCACVLAAWPTASALADDPAPVRVELTAPGSCPTANDFLAALAARAPVRAAGADEAAYGLRVRIERSARGDYVGYLGSSSTAGVAERRLASTRCADVVRALALSAALALETGQWQLEAALVPRAAPGTVSPADEPRASEPSGSEPVARDPPDAPARSAPPAADAGVRPPVREQETASATSSRALPAPATRSERSPWQAWLGLGAASAWLSLPVALGPFLSAEVRPKGPVVVRVRAAVLFPAARSDEPVSLLLPIAALDVCPQPLHLSHGFALMPCATLEGGGLRGRGRALAERDSATLLYASAGATLRALWERASLALELDAGAQGVWSQPDFTVAPSGRSVHDTGPLAITLSGGASYRFR